MIDKFLTRIRDARALARIASALERIAAAQEEGVRLQRISRGGGAGFYTGYEGEAEGQVLDQSDEEMARWEDIEARQARGEHVDDSELPR